MEDLNKKTLLHIFLGLIFIQASVLLAISANFLLAETGELQINFDSTPPSSIYGENTISAFTNIEPDSVEFRVMGTQSSIFPGIASSSTNYYFVWDTTSFPDGNYYVKAIAQKGTIETYAIFNVNVDNSSSSSTPPGITVRTEDNQTILQGTKYFYADISTEHSLNDLIFYLGDYSFHGGVSPDLSSWSAILDTSVLSDGEYNFYAEGLYDGTLYNSQNDISVIIDNNMEDTGTTTPADTDLIIEFIDLSSSPLSGDQTIYTQTSGTSSVTFKVIPGVNGTAYTEYPGTLASGSIDKYSFTWPTTSFIDGTYRIRAIAYNNENVNITYIDTYTDYLQVQNKTTSDGDSSSDNTTNQIVEITVSESGNRKDFKAISNVPLESAMFHFDDLSDSASSVRFPGVLTNTTDWTLNLADSDLVSNIDYNFYVSGYFEGTLHSSVNDILIAAQDIEVTTDDNTLQEPLILTFIERFETPLSGDQRISISSNQEIYGCIFKIYGSRYEQFPAIKDSSTKYHFILHTKDFLNGNYTIKAVAKNDIEMVDVRLDIKIENLIAPKPDQPITTEPILDEPISIKPEPTEPTCSIKPIEPTEQPIVEPTFTEPISITEPLVSFPTPLDILVTIPEICKEKSLLTPRECQEYLQVSFECIKQNIIDQEECKKYMFKLVMPEKCLLANATTQEECAKIILLNSFPQKCRDEGTTTREECEKIMNIQFNLTEECKNANIQTLEKCKNYMLENYISKECLNENISTKEECEIYLREKYFSRECLEAGVKTKSECDEIMFKKFGQPECLEAGIKDEEECQEFIFNKYSPKVECSDLEEWQCKNLIKDEHLGTIASKQAIFSELRENVSYLAGETIELKKLEEKIKTTEKLTPLKENEIKLRIVHGKEKIIFGKEDNLIQTSPIIIMIDSDLDGLPDDLEKRIGTDPNEADTDSDGYKDGEEVKNGYNPLGSGSLKNKISPIDEAILQNRSLGHPKTEGKETKDLVIKDIINIANEQTGSAKGYVLSGKSKPNSTVALYIYSDLPLVITTETDKYGNWKYELSKSLTEGEHEVYVTINDNTGKVIEKSKPLNFFIKEASAVSVKDFVSVAKASPGEPKESETSIYYYILITLFMTVIGISLFIAVIVNKKKNQSLQG